MSKPVLRGLVIVAFFVLTAFALIPVYVPRPAFIPGFAPPPDMWPRTVSICGIALGVVALALALLRPAPEVSDEVLETDGSSRARMIARFAALLAAFAAFLIVLPWTGFLIATMALTLSVVLLTGERGHRIWIVLLSFAGPVLLMLFFHAALGTQFPKGVLTKPFGF